MTTPRLLDLFCGSGGASMGYRRAGFDVTGVDIEPQPHYPFKFVQADALEVLTDHAFLAWFQAIAASPPCQDYSKHMRHLSGDYERLIEPVRTKLEAVGAPWVIENVPGAPLPTQSDLFGSHGVELCGTMFGLRIFRHRLFETSFPVVAPRGCDHSVIPMNPHYAPHRKAMRAMIPEGAFLEPAWRAEMGIDWKVTDHEGREMIPPAYTEYLGGHLLGVLEAAA